MTALRIAGLSSPHELSFYGPDEEIGCVDLGSEL